MIRAPMQVSQRRRPHTHTRIHRHDQVSLLLLAHDLDVPVHTYASHGWGVSSHVLYFHLHTTFLRCLLCALLSKQDIIWAGPRTSQLLNRDGFRDCLKAGQSVNRIPGMALALRKASLDAALAACRLLRPRGFNFRPRCWNLPAQGDALVAWAQARTRDASWLIIKPDGGSEGRGIVLLAAADLDLAAVREITEREGVCVAEEYIADPMLCEGFKFDLRGKFVVAHHYEHSRC